MRFPQIHKKDDILCVIRVIRIITEAVTALRRKQRRIRQTVLAADNEFAGIAAGTFG